MSRLLYVKVSPRGERSHCLTAADAFVQAWRAANPASTVVERNLFQYPLPEFDADAVTARYLAGRDLPSTEAQKAAWEKITAECREFAGYGRYVFALPMWNFSIPYRLKQYIDILTQPGLTFRIGEKGYEGLITGKPAFVAYASGGEYLPGTPAQQLDFQKPYFEFWLKFIGFTDIRTVRVEPTQARGPEAARECDCKAVGQATRLAADF